MCFVGCWIPGKNSGSTAGEGDFWVDLSDEGGGRIFGILKI